MALRGFDRKRLTLRPLAERENRVDIEKDHVTVRTSHRTLPLVMQERVAAAAAGIKRAREQERPVILAFGAHLIKNGLAPVLIQFLEEGWITHLATNGAGIIHDWEFAYQGASSEHVQKNIESGLFGLWQETGFNLNLAIIVGAFQGLGYGESVGALVSNDGLDIPSTDELMKVIGEATQEPERAAAAADLLGAIKSHGLESGLLKVTHPYKAYGLQAAAYRLGIPYTAHPMFGHDIIYTHPMNLGAAIGRTAERDFLAFAGAVEEIEGGVYLSIGSAVMSPMVFEKSISMAQNIAIQNKGPIRDFSLYIVDLAESDWDWQTGEPPESDPAYYVRYLKSFSRVGGRMNYIQADNRDFLISLYREIHGR
ncbi:MAG TPA: hypothetical protein VMW69_10675 [Spirochaetia bacterium]|nr:hypothetical protein [Spirochaetia bacterium]